MTSMPFGGMCGTEDLRRQHHHVRLPHLNWQSRYLRHSVVPSHLVPGCYLGRSWGFSACQRFDSSHTFSQIATNPWPFALCAKCKLLSASSEAKRLNASDRNGPSLQIYSSSHARELEANSIISTRRHVLSGRR